MAYKIIPITQRPDGSLSVDLKNIQIRQGDYDLYQLAYLSNTDYANDVDIQVSFRRRDGQQTGYISLTKLSGNRYLLNMKSRWFTNEAGNLYLTIRAKKVSDNNVDLILHTNSISIPVQPVTNFNPIEDILPTDFEQYKIEINDRFEELNNRFTSITDNIDTLEDEKLDKDFSNYQSFNMSNLNGQEKIIVNSSNGEALTVPLEEVLNNVETVNGVPVDSNKNIQIDADDIDTVYGNTINEELVDINRELDKAVYTDGLNNLFDKAGVPIKPVTDAVDVKTTKSNVQEQLDEIENEIRYVHLFKGVFVNENSLLVVWPNGQIYENGIWAILLDTDTVWLYDNDTKKWKDTGNAIAKLFSVNNKFPDETGNILLTGADIYSTVGLNGEAVTETITQHIQTLYNQAKTLQTNLGLETQNRINADNSINSRIDTSNSELNTLSEKVSQLEDDLEYLSNNLPDDYVDLDSGQSISGQKTFEQPIKLSSGTNIDTISNTSDGVSIDSSSGKNLLNINETLETISAFNKTLAFDEDVPTKTSDITNDGDGNSPFATKQYVEQNGGKIDAIKVDGVTQSIVNKEVDILLASRFNAKLDKVSTTGATKVYGIDTNGSQTMYSVSQNATASNIVQRKSDGQITVPNLPASQTDATSKEYVDNAVASISGQNEYIGSYNGTTYTTSTIQSELTSFVQSLESRSPRQGDLVNIVNAGNGVDYSGQQWIYDGNSQTWKYYITFETHDVINNLTSTSTNDGLSANQGRVLKGMIDDLQSEISTVGGRVDGINVPSKTSDLTNDGSDGTNPFITSNVNDLVNYYTKSQTDTKLNDYLLKANVANNLTTTSSGSALDARQGKVLNDSITTTNNNLNATNQNLTNLASRVDDAEDDIATNMADIAGHTQSISTLNSSVSSLQTSVSGITERISTAETEITRVEGLIPTTTEELTNNSGFITNAVNNLTNYYKKTETYTQSEVNQLIANVKQFKAEIVNSLPSTGVSGTIYLVPKSTSSTNNVYDEYMWINNKWENIGATTVDLSNYYNKSQTYSRTEINGFLNAKANQSSLDTTNASITNLTSRVSTLETNIQNISFTALKNNPITVTENTSSFSTNIVKFTNNAFLITTANGQSSIQYDSNGGLYLYSASGIKIANDTTMQANVDFTNSSSWLTPYLLAFKNANTSQSVEYPYTGFYQWGDEWQVNARDSSNAFVHNILSINLVSKVANFSAIPTVNGSNIAMSSDLGTQCTFSLSGTTLTITPK